MPIGFFDETQEPRFPHPPIPLSIFLVVEMAICAGWHLLKSEPRAGFNLLTAHEDEITHELHEAVFNRVLNDGLVDGFNKQVFSVISREPKLRNYNYTVLDKMPDLLIGMVNRPSGLLNTQDGLFIECKPVDRTHSAGQHYCDLGLIRFVRGDYAWAMTSALMIGYARDNYTIVPKLSEALKVRASTIPTITELQPCACSSSGADSEVVYLSKHERSFCYGDSESRAAAITIRHLWLRRD